MIESFADKKLEAFWDTGRGRGIPSDIVVVLQRKLMHLNHASTLTQIGTPPAMRLEALKGDLSGCHSIRVNAQWRLVFRWKDDKVCDLKLMDYHH